MKWKIFRNSNPVKGFTLIELIVVFSVIAILSTAGLAAFVTFSRQQTVNTTVQEIKTLVFDARSRASSQVSLCPNGQNFLGYLVILCPKSDTCAACNLGNSSSSYQIDIRCGNGGSYSDTIVGSAKTIPTNLAVTADSHNLLFSPLTGTVTPQCDGLSASSWNISVSGYSITPTPITVYSTGIIK